MLPLPSKQGNCGSAHIQRVFSVAADVFPRRQGRRRKTKSRLLLKANNMSMAQKYALKELAQLVLLDVFL